MGKIEMDTKKTKRGSMAFGLFLAIFSSALFGLLPLFSIPAMDAGVGLNSLLVYRFGVATIVMGVIAKCYGISLKISLRDLLAMVLVACGYAGCSIFLTMSYSYMPSGIATTIFFLFPIIVATIMVIFFKERLSWKIVLASILAMSGVYLLQGTGTSGQIGWEGLLVLFCSMVAYSWYVISINHSRAKDMPNMKAIFYVFLLAFVINVIKLLIMDGPHIDKIPDTRTLFLLLGLGVIPTMVGDLILIYAVRIVGSTTIALLSCMEPITAYIVGVLVFKEAFHPIQIVGLVVIICSISVVILTRGKIKEEKKQQLQQQTTNL